MKGFFNSSELTKRISIPLFAECGKCGLYKTCLSPKMPVDGEGRKGILICGEAPGETESKKGKPFVGKAGKHLENALRKFGIDLRKDCWIINSARCRPPRNNLPIKAVEYCRPNVIKDIKELKPKKIFLFGKAAVESVIGWLWKEKPGEIGRWTGWHIPNQKLNSWLIPLWHPSYVMRADFGASGKDRDMGSELRQQIWEGEIEAAAELKGRPWNDPKSSLVEIFGEGKFDFDSRIKTIMDVQDAAKEIEKFGEDKPIAFDIETNMLKPDSKQAKIVCCSISNGEISIAYPWAGEAIEATRKLIYSQIPKIGQNVKMEERWFLKYFRRPIPNWVRDDMTDMHILDCRRGITRLKFMAFTLLGVEDYSDSIRPYLEAKGGNTPNRIDELVKNSFSKLLKYNAQDSLYEWWIAKIQAKKLGEELC